MEKLITPSPSFFYKYFPPSRIDSVLGELLVRYTQPAIFNDPFDTAPPLKPTQNRKRIWEMYLKVVEQEAQRQFPKNIAKQKQFIRKEKSDKKKFRAFRNSLSSEEFWKNNPEQHQESLSRDTGVFCFGTKGNSILMWAHYTESYKGFVVEFDAFHPYFQDAVFPVHYEKERPIVDQELFYQYSQEEIKKALFCKFEDWQYEAEYRKYDDFEKADTVKIDPENQHYPIYLFKLPPNSIKSIYIGYRMHELNKQKIVNYQKNDSLKHIKLYLAKPDSREYKINFLPFS